MASVKKNRNNPDNKSQVKQIRLRDSGYCETQCKGTETCDKYKAYIASMVSGKVGRGLSCDK